MTEARPTSPRASAPGPSGSTPEAAAAAAAEAEAAPWLPRSLGDAIGALPSPQRARRRALGRQYEALPEDGEARAEAHGETRGDAHVIDVEGGADGSPTSSGRSSGGALMRRASSGSGLRSRHRKVQDEALLRSLAVEPPDSAARGRAARWFRRQLGMKGDVVSPSSPFMGYWDALLELAVLVAVVQAPIAWAFTPRDELAGVYSPLDAGDVLVLVEWLVIYAVFAGDVWLSWKLGYMDSGALVVDRKKIRERYVRTRLAWDLLACVPALFWPVELAAAILMPVLGGSGDSGGEPNGFARRMSNALLVVAYVRLICVFFKLRTAKYKMDTFTEFFSNRYGTLMTKIAELVLYFLLLTNVLTCVWFASQVESTAMNHFDDINGDPAQARAPTRWFFGVQNSWLASRAGTLEPNAPTPEDKIKDPLVYQALMHWIQSNQTTTRADKVVLYINCFYWASNAGDGYDTEQTMEMLTAIFSQILLNYGFVAFLTAALISALEEFNRAGKRRALYRKKVDTVNDFLRKHDFEEGMTREIRQFYESVWLPQRVDYTEESLVKELPHYLKEKVMTKITRDVIVHSEFFSKYFADFMREDPESVVAFVDLVSERVKPMYFIPKQFLIKEGDTGTDMYFIKEGNVAVHKKGVGVVVELGPGAYIGEVALLGLNPHRSASIITLSNTTVYQLTKRDFDEIIEELPETGPGIRELMENIAKGWSRTGKAKIKAAAALVRQLRDPGAPAPAGGG